MCYGRITLLPAEKVGVFLPLVLYVSYQYRINNFYVYDLFRNPGDVGSFCDCLLDSMARVQSVDKAVFVFVSANAHRSEWLK